MCNPSALVNVCIWFVSRAHRWASKPLREVLSFFRPWGGLSKFFFRAAADVFFGRAASVGTCECRARLTGGRDGCRRFARRPHNTPVRASCRLSRGICCAAPHGERCSATVHAVLVTSARVRTERVRLQRVRLVLIAVRLCRVLRCSRSVSCGAAGVAQLARSLQALLQHYCCPRKKTGLAFVDVLGFAASACRAL